MSEGITCYHRDEALCCTDQACRLFGCMVLRTPRIPSPLDEALDAAALAIDEYYNGDRAWAEQWLLRAYEANQKEKAR